MTDIPVVLHDISDDGLDASGQRINGACSQASESGVVSFDITPFRTELGEPCQCVTSIP